MEEKEETLDLCLSGRFSAVEWPNLKHCLVAEPLPLGGLIV